MAELWAQEEMRNVRLEDRRLNERLQQVLSQLGNRPTASIPAACGGHAEMTAAYRLFDNDKVTFERILAPHAEATRARMALQSTVVLAQDTTQVDLTRPEQQVKGAGPLSAGPRRGMFLHVMHAFCEDGTPLGTLGATAWARPKSARDDDLAGLRARTLPIERKESYRWVQTLRQAQAEARLCPATRMICVGDSESDIYEFLAQAQSSPENANWIVRACKDRAVKPDGDETRRLREQVAARPVLFTQTVNVRGRKAQVACDRRQRRQPRKSREATLEVRAASNVILQPPWRPGGRPSPATVNVVLALEKNAPPNDVPVEWLLLTGLPVDTPDSARDVIGFYCLRWMIEVFFRVLKSGCRVEQRRFERIERFQACLAVYLIVAWRTLYICRLGRACPEVDCEALFDPTEWKAVWMVARRSPLPASPPSLGEIIRLVAQLGGYIPRKNSPPGPQTIWIGLQRTKDFAHCWRIFGPDARENNPYV